MPNRIIKESITTSEKLASLSDFEFRLWIGLITQADDAGRGDARPAVIKGRVFPFRERLTVKDVGSSLRAPCASCVFSPLMSFPSPRTHFNMALANIQ